MNPCPSGCHICFCALSYILTATSPLFSAAPGMQSWVVAYAAQLGCSPGFVSGLVLPNDVPAAGCVLLLWWLFAVATLCVSLVCLAVL